MQCTLDLSINYFMFLPFSECKTQFNDTTTMPIFQYSNYICKEIISVGYRKSNCPDIFWDHVCESINSTHETMDWSLPYSYLYCLFHYNMFYKGTQ